MSKGLRYRGTMASRAGVVTEVRILTEGWTGAVSEVRFAGEEPIVIEWGEKEIEDAIHGSVATLKLMSEGDRTLAGLYTIKAGETAVEIDRGGVAYWRGTIDAELYEEPYSEASDYEVTITASDLGMLDRVKCPLSGRKTIEEIVRAGLEACGLGDMEIDESLITTELSAGSGAMTLSALSVQSGNWTDEDGEVMTMADVMEAALQPLGLMLWQRCGKMWAGDVNGLATAGATEAAEWMSDDAELSTEKVYGKVKITFSPYASGELLKGNITMDDATDASQINLTSVKPEDGEYYSYNPTLAETETTSSGDAIIDDLRKRLNPYDKNNVSMTIHLSKHGSGVAELAKGWYFKMVPQLGGEDCEGVCWGIVTTGDSNVKSGRVICADGNVKTIASSGQNRGQAKLMTTPRAWLPALSESERAKYKIRLTEEILVDDRYNYTNEASTSDEKALHDQIEDDWSYVMIPVSVKLWRDGEVKWHYDNTAAASAIRTDVTQVQYWETSGEWLHGDEGEERTCWLEYYDKEDRKKKSGVLGWKKNRQNIGATRTDLQASFMAMEDGQYIPYPPEEGEIEITVWAGVWPYWDIHWGQYQRLPLNNPETWTTGDDRHREVTYRIEQALERVRWVLYKGMTAEVVRNCVSTPTVESEDVEYKGVINADAKEDLDLDTKCGTMRGAIPTAKGVYLLSSSGAQVETLSRAGHTTQAEKLLMGTLSTHYGSRHTMLSGTMSTGGAATVLTEASESGKKFLIKGSSEDLGEDLREVTMVEIEADDWEE